MKIWGLNLIFPVDDWAKFIFFIGKKELKAKSLVETSMKMLEKNLFICKIPDKKIVLRKFFFKLASPYRYGKY